MPEDEDEEYNIADLIREQRLHSEFCGWCSTRHHPDGPCQEDLDKDEP